MSSTADLSEEASAPPPPSSSKTPGEETNKKEEKTKGQKEIDNEQDRKMIQYIMQNKDFIRDKSLIKDKSLQEIRHLAKNMEGGKDMINAKDGRGRYPLHLACGGGASLEVIRYLVENMEGGAKDMINAKDEDGRYPLHYACRGGASLKMIRYLVENMEGGAKDMINAKDDDGMYPLHYACRGGASVEVIRYLVENVEGGAKDMINAKDDRGRYPLHCACRGGASLEVIRYLIECGPGLTTVSDNQGSIPVDYLETSKAAKLFGESKTGATTDKTSAIDQLGYSTYARALAKSVRLAETPNSSLCVGLYGTWGSGKSTLWRHIVKHLKAEFQTEDAHCLQEQCSSEENKRNAANICFKKARTKVLESRIIGKDVKKAFKGETVDNRLPFGKWCLFHFLRFLCGRPKDKANAQDEESVIATDVPMSSREYNRHRREKYNMRRRDERHALVFSVLVILSVLIVAPVLIALVFYVKTSKIDKENTASIDKENTASIDKVNTASIDKGNTASVDKVWDLIMGDASVGMGGYGDINLWSGFVIMLLRIVQSTVGGIKTMYSWFRCCFDPDVSDSAPPEGLPKYAIVKFNAWAYSGSDQIWASLIKILWDEVVREFGQASVGLHRAKIHIAGESPIQSPGDLSKSEKQEKREAAWIKYKITGFAYTVLSIAAIAGSIFIIPWISQSIDGNNTTDVNNTDNTVVIATWLCASLGSSPLLLQVVIFFIKIFPFLRQSRGEYLRKKASAIASSKRKDFSAEEGFMGEVKREVEYLFDLLTNETYMDKKIGCKRSLRLCVFVDDLDRCPSNMVVRVLEAVILLLVDGPITCWLAIDNRIVVESIKAHNENVYKGAEIHGHEYLDKIVQLPFCLPDLSTQHKESYLSKMIEGDELKPSRVSAQINSYMDAEKTEEELGNETFYLYHKHERSSRNRIMRKNERSSRENRIMRKRGNSSLTDNERAISSLLSHYHAMKKMGHEINRQDCHIFGMGVSDLVATIERSIDNSLPVQEEHIENFCLLMKTEHHKWKTHAAKKNSEHLKWRKTHASKVLLTGAVQKQEDTTIPPSNQDQSTAPPIRSQIDYLSSKNLDLPMFSKAERDTLDNYCWFLNGNARKLKRIINIFNVCRSIFDYRSQNLNSTRSSDLSTSQILRFVILLEQWQCRMSWLLQLVAAVDQQKTYSLDTNSNLPTLEKVKDMDAATFFCKFVDRRMHDCEKLTGMLLLDADHQLFLGLLKNKPALTVEDFLPSNDGGKMVLRDYEFNLPTYIKAKVRRYLAKEDANILD